MSMSASTIVRNGTMADTATSQATVRGQRGVGSADALKAFLAVSNPKV